MFLAFNLFILFQVDSSNLHTFLDNHEKQLLFGAGKHIQSKFNWILSHYEYYKHIHTLLKIVVVPLFLRHDAMRK